MKQLTCEMCGSNDLVKQEGVFVCQSCGCKYSVEEAKKMMVEGTVEVTGTVKVDKSDNLSNLYLLARRAREDNNSENAAKYYGEILLLEPNSWEANFYSTYYNVEQTTIGNIPLSATKLNNCLKTAIELLVNDEDKQVTYDNIVMLQKDLFSLSLTLFSAFRNYFLRFRANAQICVSYNMATLAITQMLYNFGDLIEKHFGNEEKYVSISVSSWKQALEYRKTFFGDSPVYGNTGIGDTKESIEKEVRIYSEKIKRVDSKYETPTVTGCYIATCIYGSYDCPQVWTLRRFRDNTLAETMLGRAFIRTYYAISPTLVRWFGDTSWFKKMWKGTLDRMVSKLQANGVEDTPYQDRNWR